MMRNFVEDLRTLNVREEALVIASLLLFATMIVVVGMAVQ
jgi:hypothetical protein